MAFKIDEVNDYEKNDAYELESLSGANTNSYCPPWLGDLDLAESFGMGQESDCLHLPILGEKQFHKVEALQEAFLKESELLKHDLLTKRTELRILGLPLNPDPAAVKAKEKEIRDLQAKLQQKTMNLRFEIWKILTPEQQAQFSLYGPGIGFNLRRGRASTSG